MEINIQNYNTIESLMKLKNTLTENIDKRIKEIQIEDEASKLKDKSFGFIKTAFENLSESLFSTKKGRKLIDDYINLIKNNKNLYIMHTLYEGIRKSNSNGDINFVIESIIKGKEQITKALKDDKDKMANILSEAYVLVGDKAKTMMPNENITLDNAIAYLVENTQKLENIFEYSQALNILKGEIGKNTDKNIFERNNAFDIENAENVIKEVNKKYHGKLTPSEQKIVNEIAICEDKEGIFNSYKENCCNTLSEAISKMKKENDNESAERAENVLNKIQEKKFSQENLLTDIVNLSEITEIFKK